jgi:Plasmid pRiA4b ORF-3-like protein
MAQTKRKMKPTRAEYALQLLVVLAGTDPLVWRRIQVPGDYSFWDLHVAIQDAMGWEDYHLHEFTLVDRNRRLKTIGIPDDEMPGAPRCVAGWRVPIRRYVLPGVGPIRYRYDFGDGWDHAVELEDLVPNDGGPFPRCVGGAGACPPEDVGGVHGYRMFLEIIGDSGHPDHARMLEWAGGRFDPEAFRADSVEFDDPAKRLEMAFPAE